MKRKSECMRVFAGAVVLAYALYTLTAPTGLPWAAAALVWTFLPPVWNQAILGSRSIVLVSLAICGGWALDAVLRAILRKLLKMRAEASSPGRVNDMTAAAANDKRSRTNGLMGWIFLGAAGMFAIVSLTLHDYQMGEAASVFAQGVVEEAGERIVMLNGVLDEQVVKEVEKVKGGGQGQERIKKEVRELTAAVRKNAPGEVKKMLHEKLRSGDILK